MIENARKYSRPEPRITNKLGLRAPIDRYIEACQRHVFETQEIPKAQEHGWPKHIDFKDVVRRVKSRTLHARLQEVIDEPFLSKFWREIVSDIQEKGVRSVMSSVGQLAAFDRVLPG